MEPQPNSMQFGKYQVLETIGYGSMGVVYKCLDPNFERVVAVKAVHGHLLDSQNTNEFLQRFKNELLATGRLSHPNIVMVFDADFEARPPYLVMEFVEGQELSRLIKQSKRFDFREIVQICTDILNGLSEIHHFGIIHRDLKPDNIFITRDGKAKIADFGIAKLEDSNLTQVGAIIGSPKYMSPEQCMGYELDPRSDLFSVGTILFELLTGESCFRGKSYTAIAQKIISDAPSNPSDINPEIPEIFDKLTRKALSKDPVNRFQTPDEFIAALELAEQKLLKKTSKVKGPITSDGDAHPPPTWPPLFKWILICAPIALVTAFTIIWQSYFQNESIALPSGEPAGVTPEIAGPENLPRPVDPDSSNVSQKIREEESVSGISTRGAVLNPIVDGRDNRQHTQQLDLSNQQKIDRLIKVAGAHMSVGRLISPSGSNALEAYKIVLSMDPYNEKALAGIEDVKDFIVREVEVYIAENSLNKAEDTLLAAKAVFPADPAWSRFEVELANTQQ
ncbi:serine/threonine protein kinase [Oleiphilus messinensis]|uniref:non-specific serine/threonine protein kinase n=1 Tax=Oleiphilus messinensis TaxID=141451 RepID=A0A1Y0I628_9GAMM|nr:serine/threonine-protein kinase [Oleiphilus messinensis]ARU55690.1 serine/threonine protein kinase [Oleiphilus messinensis]